MEEGENENGEKKAYEQDISNTASEGQQFQSAWHKRQLFDESTLVNMEYCLF